MFTKKSWNKIKFCLGMLLCALAVVAAPATTLISYAAVIPEAETHAEIKKWFFKIEDGKLYKRLYNASTGLWETDWIYVGEYTE